jgi:hypothetical protein
MAKSWTDKFNAPADPVVKLAPVSIAGMRAGQVMLVPTPRMIADFMAAIPFGETVEVPSMRRELARRHGAEVTCPIYTGYHLRTVAEAALEVANARATPEAITPFWRVLDETAPTTRRLPNGPAFVRERRDSER